MSKGSVVPSPVIYKLIKVIYSKVTVTVAVAVKAVLGCKIYGYLFINKLYVYRYHAKRTNSIDKII